MDHHHLSGKLLTYTYIYKVDSFPQDNAVYSVLKNTAMCSRGLIGTCKSE